MTLQNTQVSMDFHIDQLQKHCRICANRLCKVKGKKQPVHSCINHKEDLLTFVGVHISSDDELTSPSKFCNSCYLRIGRAKKAKMSGFPTPSIKPMMDWTPHQENCTVREIIIIIIKITI